MSIALDKDHNFFYHKINIGQFGTQLVLPSNAIYNEFQLGFIALVISLRLI